MDSDTLLDPMEMKVRELLKEFQIDYSPTLLKLVEDTVSAIKKAIKLIPDDLKVTAAAAPGFIRDIGADKVEFKFRKPKSIKIGGSYTFQGIAKPDVNVDLLIGLPKECFHEKDYLNYRYHAKRFLYLCTIKKYLNSSSMFSKVEWSTFQNEARKPVLIVHPAFEELKVAPGFFIRIIPTIAASFFSISKLNLKRNNIHALNQGSLLPATPKYNTSILEDMYFEDTAEMVKKPFLELKSLVETLILLKVWARQRAPIYVHDCLSGFSIAVILSYLITHNIINHSMTAVQMFRVALKFIASSDLWNRGLYFKLGPQSTISKEEKKQYKDLFPVVICNPSSNFNIAFRISQSGFAELQDEAAMALACLEKCSNGGFEEVFMTKIDFAVKYDHCIRLTLRGQDKVYTSGFCMDDECWRLYEQKVHGVLSQGLTDRAKFIRVSWRNTEAGCDIENGLSVFDTQPLLVGFSISSVEKAFRVVDIGPDADNKEDALKFRRFWGEKAELRRFKDGRIAESTVWETDQWTRHLILKRIVEYIFVRHLSPMSNNHIMHAVDQIDFSLLHGSRDPITFSGTLLAAFEVLSKRLRSIEDIPLKVSAVQPLDSAFRYTSVYPPEPHPLAEEKASGLQIQKTFAPSCIHPLEVMIQLEGSGNWPTDEVAIEKTKTAFLLKIGESLQNVWGMTCIASEDSVNVLVSGYAFRLKIWHERGLSLLSKESGNELSNWISSTDKQLFIQNQHSSMISGLQARHSIYGPVVRLAKRWVASHFFSACLVEEAVELLVASIFLKPLPFHAPLSRITGFLRFLRLLSEYDWTFSPLVIDINNDLGANEEKEIADKFNTTRKDLQENPDSASPAMFLATAYDKASEAWTRFSPKLSELKRLAAYARSSADLLTRLILQHQVDSYQWECLFRTPLTNYDAVILLHRDKLPYPQRLLFPSELNRGIHIAKGNPSKIFSPYLSPRNLKACSDNIKDKLLVNFDPLSCYIADLQKEFSNTFNLWYDSLGGDAIGVTWGRHSSKKRGRGDEAVKEEKEPAEVLKSAGETGKGLMRSIYLLKAPRLTT
ncbi:nucleolar protein 6 [Benincasa hispida]|uniref:nucleolar protein 6 n=1 Tax=Benincasa hispida TaxID=102211 RepID=UPI0019002621|nr:nucleolar protein 6 [Benincasa hispida]XP_038874531.1 nucleolar protein 6 [Benincasa hispida]XP_038874532.1 nucleolar protein 6 [Benincasa hispida]